MSFSDIEPGKIVYCQFPCNEGGDLPHYGLVVSVVDDLVGTRYRVAYGSSKKVSESGALPHEFVIADRKGMEAAGLRKPTRFDMGRISKLYGTEIKQVTGSVDLTNGRLVRRLLAALEAGERTRSPSNHQSR